MGRFGQKTGAGWYKYDQNRKPIPDAEIQAMVAEAAKKAGIPQRNIGAEEIVDRTIYALVNEGARILEEGIALRAVDIDVIYLHGYGFPAYRGGPMWYADTVGLKKVRDRILEFGWQPAPLLASLAQEGKTFASLDA
jgi:3-hydroxyacyl-CoA dehydrogenase